MSESATFLILGAIFSLCVAWGFATGDMPTQFLYGDRAKHPKWFWAAGAMHTFMALICFGVAWAGW